MCQSNNLRIRISVLLVFCLIIGLCGCSKTMQGAVSTRDCNKYVDYSFQAAFYGEYYDYIKNGGNGPEAVNLHEKMINYLLDNLYYKYGIATDCLNEVILAEYFLTAENLLKRASFEVIETKKINGEYSVEVAVKPLIFWQLVNAFCGADYQEYQALLSSGEIASYSENTWHIYMQEYAEKILKGIHTIQERVSGQTEAKHILIHVKVTENDKLSIDNSEFYAVCDYILNLK